MVNRYKEYPIRQARRRIPDSGSSKKLAGFFMRNLEKMVNAAPGADWPGCWWPMEPASEPLLARKMAAVRALPTLSPDRRSALADTSRDVFAMFSLSNIM
jgi:hypothetical protein